MSRIRWWVTSLPPGTAGKSVVGCKNKLLATDRKNTAKKEGISGFFYPWLKQNVTATDLGHDPISE